MAKTRKNIPTADVLMTSMRSMGYSFEAAIADVLDNSVSAKAHNIIIRFPIDPNECYVAICDDGIGMSKDDLFDAMKYGSQNKKNYRAEEDLGRFGLGLKAASLSQCEKLTVISKHENEGLAAYCWDLDVIKDSEDWDLVEYNQDEIDSLKFVDFLNDKTSGTVVLWEEFDVLEKNAGNVYAELSRYQQIVAEYLSLIFHRYLSKDGEDRLNIYINHFQLEAKDPFLEKHKKTNPRRKITLPIMDSHGNEQIITVQPFILPFQKDMTAADKKMVGGIEDYRTKQGFYIYRNERLIIWGTWFGRPRGELTKHARIKVDIPNSLDDIWCIDIKKQVATIPNIIKNQLKKAVDEAMDLAVKAQAYRGRIKNVDENIDYVWNRIQEREGSFQYKINRESVVFDLIKTKVDDDTWNRIDMVLEEIENAVPFQQIYIDKTQNKVDESLPENTLDIEAKAKMLVKAMMSIDGCGMEDAIDRVFKSEPFCNYKELKAKIKE